LSMYLKTPDGLRLEFTVDAPDADEIADMRRKDAHSELARWLAGDRRANNDDRPH
jgi:glyoxylase I family protein